MKKIGRILSLLLVIAMLVALAVGCGTKNGSASKGGEVSKPADSGKSSAVSSGKEEEPAAEPYTVQVMLPNGTGKSLADEAMIEEAINAITVPEINCKVDLYFVGFGQQIWEPILDASVDAGAQWVVVEQDEHYDLPSLECARRSREYLKILGW